MEQNAEKMRNDGISAPYDEEMQQDTTEVQQDIIRRMETDHSIETAMLKAKLWDLQEELKTAREKLTEYEKQEKENKKLLTEWQEEHTDLYSIPEDTSKVVIDAETATKRLLPGQFRKLLEILTALI